MKLSDISNESIVSTGGQRADDYEAFIEIHGDIVEGGAITSLSIPDWRTAKALTKLKSQINEAHPGRNKAKDGEIGDASHCPGQNHTGNSDHCLNIVDGAKRVVTASDVTNDPAKCDVGVIVEAIRSDKDARIKYIIWNKRICNSSKIGSAEPWEWRDYDGTDPHTGHAHFSVKSTKSKFDDEADWKIS
ncbi:MAG: hypothetical protein JAY67_19465 [Candidatus Thiodiazotropha taylori]|nr:hypothetical protein [Candidatus Thiodiazotropha taylori]